MRNIKSLLLIFTALFFVNANAVIKVDIDNEKEICNLGEEKSEICLLQNKSAFNLSIHKLEQEDINKYISQFSESKQKKFQAQATEQNNLREKYWNTLEAVHTTEAYQKAMWLLFILLCCNALNYFFSDERDHQTSEAGKIMIWLYVCFSIFILLTVQTNFEAARAIGEKYSIGITKFQQFSHTVTIESLSNASSINEAKEAKTDADLDKTETTDFKKEYNDTAITTGLYETAIAQNRNIRREAMLRGDYYHDTDTLITALQPISTNDLRTTFGTIGGAQYSSVLDFGEAGRYASLSFKPYLVNENSLVEKMQLENFVKDIKDGSSFEQAAGPIIDDLLSFFAQDGAIDDVSRRIVDRMLFALADIYRSESDVLIYDQVIGSEEMQTAVNLTIDSYCLSTGNGVYAKRWVEDLTVDTKGSLDCVGVIDDSVVALGKIENEDVLSDTEKELIDEQIEKNKVQINEILNGISNQFADKRYNFQYDYVLLHAKVYNTEKRLAIMREKGNIGLAEYVISTYLQNTKDYTTELSSPRNLQLNFNRYYLTNSRSESHRIDYKDSDMDGLLSRDFVRDILSPIYQENRETTSLYDVQQRAQFSKSTLYNSTNLDESKEAFMNDLRQLAVNANTIMNNTGETDRNAFQAFNDSISYMKGELITVVNHSFKYALYSVISETVLNSNKKDTRITQGSKHALYKAKEVASGVLEIASESMIFITIFGTVGILALGFIEFVVSYGLLVVGIFFNVAIYISTLLVIAHFTIIVPLQLFSSFGYKRILENMKMSFLILLMPFVLQITSIIVFVLTPQLLNVLFSIYGFAMELFNYLLSSVGAFAFIAFILGVLVRIATFPAFIIIFSNKTLQILVEIITQIYKEDDFYDQSLNQLVNHNKDITSVIESGVANKFRQTQKAHKKAMVAKKEIVDYGNKLYNR